MTQEKGLEGTTLRIAEASLDSSFVEGSLARRPRVGAREWTDGDAEALAFAKSVMRSESAAILSLIERLDTRFCEAVATLLECRGCVVASGMGKAGIVARKIAATLSSTGTPAHFVHPGEAYHGDLGAFRTGDVALIFSYSGETEEVKRILGPLSSRNIPIISIVSTSRSALGRASTVVLELGKVDEADSLKLAPSSSAAAMLAMGDALALTTSRLRGFGREDFARFHPGGTLGRSLSRVCELMRPLSLCRVARDSMTLRDVFTSSRKVGRRSGAVLLVDSAGRLSGIFTDSDLARLFEARREDAFDRPISEVFTPSPTTIRADAPMREAIEILSERKLSELPALDEDGRPVGMLDVTDLVGFLPEDEDKKTL
ncbi:MAG: KpsF/GutQ family sugar-phosphate isomerase [Thermoguttaceae bacterium]|jgi:arabinose-5-phosphate isomerase